MHIEGIGSDDSKEHLIEDLPQRSELVVLARALHKLGCKDNELGAHISYLLPDGTILITPQEILWDGLRPDQVLRVDPDGNLIGPGRWSPMGKELHFAVHSRMPHATVSIHYHGPWSTTWANLQRVPPVYNTNSLLTGEVELFHELENGSRAGVGERFIETLGPKGIVLLANHGVFIVGRSPAEVFHRCAGLEWRSKMAWHAEVLAGARGQKLEPLMDTPEYMSLEMGDTGVAPALWKCILARELEADPSLGSADV